METTYGRWERTGYDESVDQPGVVNMSLCAGDNAYWNFVPIGKVNTAITEAYPGWVSALSRIGNTFFLSWTMNKPIN
jgi:hypothetical protein